jgi:hypothetical protein
MKDRTGKELRSSIYGGIFPLSHLFLFAGNNAIVELCQEDFFEIIDNEQPHRLCAFGLLTQAHGKLGVILKDGMLTQGGLHLLSTVPSCAPA